MPAYAEQNVNGYISAVQMNGNGHNLSNGGFETPSTIVFGSRPITIEDVGIISRRQASVKLWKDEKFTERINRGPAVLQKLLQDDHIIYGVNTGYGNSCTTTITKDLVADLPQHLYSFHCVGLGEKFSEEQTRALLTARLVSLTKGFSAVRLELLEQLVTLIQKDILPVVPQEGSVGASGDLTPLSYVAAVLCGERKVMYQGEIQPTESVFKQLGITPLRLIPKEGLAMMNGTSVMTGVACLAFQRAQFLAQLCTRMTSLAVVALKGNIFHYDATLFSVKEHPGQQLVAKRIRQDLDMSDAAQDYSKVARIQDRYSLRCAPHIIGVLEDALPFFRQVIERELNSANDNPIIDAETERVFHGGMFYGGHIAFVMDSLKTLVANLADLMDRQMALLVDPNYSNGLPICLSGMTGPRAAINHGLKALQIGMSAWTAEALKLTMPASVFSRSTESHNQDKVSMGTIAARDCVRVLELTEQVAAGLLVAVRQALTLRKTNSPNDPELKLNLSSQATGFVEQINGDIQFIKDNAPIEPILRSLLVQIRSEGFQLYDDKIISN